jgi:hypothetical protein
MCAEDVFKLSPLPALKFVFEEMSDPEQKVRIDQSKSRLYMLSTFECMYLYAYICGRLNNDIII